MLSPNAVCAVMALFIVGMVWLRTRMPYRRGAQRAPSLTRAGAAYFAAFIILLMAGWFAAPLLARTFASGAPLSPLLARFVWFLACYLLFIPVHRVLRARGVEVFKAAVAPIQQRP